MACDSVDYEKLFIREFERKDGSVLKISQSEIGDVGCVVWDAAIVLATYLECDDFIEDGKSKFWGKSVIELGAGTGLVGIQAACLGANAVITDLKEFVPLIQLNIENNKSFIKGKAEARSLKWGEYKTISVPDYLLLADCIYYDESLQPLVLTLNQLSNSETEVYCCYEQRTTGNKPELEKKFFELTQKTFNIEEIPLERQHETYHSDDIHILHFKKKS